jgi:hypothetical protein
MTKDLGIKISIVGNEVPLEDLEADVEAAKTKGYSGQFAFTPETVEGLIDKIYELGQEILTLRKVISRG